MENSPHQLRDPARKQKVVIIGGGFGGLFVAKAIHKRMNYQVDIELINDSNYFVFQPLLPEVAAGTINPTDAVSSLRHLIPGVRIRMARVIAINPDDHTITIVQGQKRKLQSLHYDQLVIASGQSTQLDTLPGFAHHSLTMKTLSDAFRLRNHVIECLEMADVTNFPAIKQRALTFVVVGGGFSGVETMGELVSLVQRALSDYPKIDKRELQFHLIQRSDRLLPEMAPSLGSYVERVFEQRGITVKLKTAVQAASRYSITLADGTLIKTQTLITTLGNGPSEFLRQLPVTLQRGKIPVDRYLQVQGTQDIWALGDAALIPLAPDNAAGDGAAPARFAPPTAQYARQEAECLARNLSAHLRGQPLSPFDYRARASLASLGNYRGVAEIYGVRVTGWAAWLIWRTVYLGMLPGISSRIRVAIDWGLDLFLSRNVVAIHEPANTATTYLTYECGETVHERDELLEGYYVVLSGRLRRELSDPSRPGCLRVRYFEAGDSWGERCLLDQRPTIGHVVAEERSELLLLRAEDFSRLGGASPPFRQMMTNLHRRQKPSVATQTEPA